LGEGLSSFVDEGRGLTHRLFLDWRFGCWHVIKLRPEKRSGASDATLKRSAIGLRNKARNLAAGGKLLAKFVLDL
jgi:hypothetical protein